MLTKRCRKLPCRKLYVTICQGRNPVGPAGEEPCSGYRANQATSNGSAICCSRKTTPFMTSRAQVTGGIEYMLSETMV
jgi:hypothetical protein